MTSGNGSLMDLATTRAIQDIHLISVGEKTAKKPQEESWSVLDLMFYVHSEVIFQAMHHEDFHT